MTIEEFENNTFITAINNEDLSYGTLQISHYGFESCKKNKEEVKLESTYSLHFIVKGAVHYTLNGKTTKLSKNSFFLLSPNENNSYITSKSSPAKYYWISFYGKNFINYLKKIDFDLQNGYIKTSSKAIKRFKNLFFSNFILSPEDKRVTDIYFSNNFLELLLLMRKEINTTKTSLSISKPQNHLTNILQYIQEHFTDSDITLDSISKAIYLNPNYISSILKTSIGISFRAYINRLRIEYAIRLIQETDLSINEIATKSGFNDFSYFTKVYKKYNHITPSEDRKK